MYKDSLYIIGNGFDLSLQIKSSYSDFKKYLQNNCQESFIRLAEIFWGNGNFWNNIEESLGYYDENHILDWCKPDEDIDDEHFMRSITAIEDSPEYVFDPAIEDLLEWFYKWVNQIKISHASKKISLPSSAKYLTFNYTDTLETLYNISSTNILHIHGSRLNLNDKYIMGHSNYRSVSSIVHKEEYVENALKHIVERMNELYKDCDNVIKKNETFFKGLNHIKHIYVYGHSLNDVDIPYFREIIKNTNNADWNISWHNSDDLYKIKHFEKNLNLVKVKEFEL